MEAIFFVFILIILLFDVSGDYFAKRGALDGKFFTLGLLIFVYAISGVLLGISLRYVELSKGTVFINTVFEFTLLSL
ncbi:MAG: hypothetical protein QG570_665 [Patescibacteria group bacterium]|nr:hypothetical protein [Patescibacteria group bacterium]